MMHWLETRDKDGKNTTPFYIQEWLKDERAKPWYVRINPFAIPMALIIITLLLAALSTPDGARTQTIQSPKPLSEATEVCRQLRGNGFGNCQ